MLCVGMSLIYTLKTTLKTNTHSLLQVARDANDQKAVAFTVQYLYLLNKYVWPQPQPPPNHPHTTAHTLLAHTPSSFAVREKAMCQHRINLMVPKEMLCLCEWCGGGSQGDRRDLVRCATRVAHRCCYLKIQINYIIIN